MKMDVCPFLKVANYAEQVLGLRIATGAKHADQTLRRRARRCSEFFKSDSGFDVVTQDRFPVSRSPESIASTPSRRSASANLASPLTCCCTRSLKLLVLVIKILRSAYDAPGLFVAPPIPGSLFVCLPLWQRRRFLYERIPTVGRSTLSKQPVEDSIGVIAPTRLAQRVFVIHPSIDDDTVL